MNSIPSRGNSPQPKHDFILTHLAPVYVFRPLNDSEAQLMAALRTLEKHWEEYPQPFVLLIDVVGMPPPSSRTRQLITEHDSRTARHKQTHCRGMGYVMDSIAMRGAFKAIVWMSPPTYPVETFSNLEDAIVWARMKLQ